eukprot:scaffold54457_cov22-Tisochrysis_lutea.AAC.1
MSVLGACLVISPNACLVLGACLVLINSGLGAYVIPITSVLFAAFLRQAWAGATGAELCTDLGHAVPPGQYHHIGLLQPCLHLYFALVLEECKRGFGWGVWGSALATTLAQYVSSVSLCVLLVQKAPKLWTWKSIFVWVYFLCVLGKGGQSG